jgi:hypothetical protein
MRTLVLLPLACVLMWGCEEKKPVEEAKPEPAPVVAAAAPAAAPAAATPEDEAAKQEAAAKAAAPKEVEEDPLTPCCRELGRMGFMERSPEAMAASQECGKAMSEKKTLPDVIGAITKAMKGKALPEACSQK